MQSIIGKFAKYILAVFIAILLFASGAVTDYGQLVAYAIAPEKALARAVELINATPKAEIVEAVKAVESPSPIVDVKDLKKE